MKVEILLALRANKYSLPQAAEILQILPNKTNKNDLKDLNKFEGFLAEGDPTKMSEAIKFTRLKDFFRRRRKGKKQIDLQTLMKRS